MEVLFKVIMAVLALAALFSNLFAKKAKTGKPETADDCENKNTADDEKINGLKVSIVDFKKEKFTQNNEIKSEVGNFMNWDEHNTGNNNRKHEGELNPFIKLQNQPKPSNITNQACNMQTTQRVEMQTTQRVEMQTSQRTEMRPNAMSSMRSSGRVEMHPHVNSDSKNYKVEHAYTESTLDNTKTSGCETHYNTRTVKLNATDVKREEKMYSIRDAYIIGEILNKPKFKNHK